MLAYVVVDTADDFVWSTNPANDQPFTAETAHTFARNVNGTVGLKPTVRVFTLTAVPESTTPITVRHANRTSIAAHGYWTGDGQWIGN